MGYYQVSEENMQKVENFFVQKVKETGSNRVEATVAGIAEGAGVALATAHNAIKQMSAKRVLQVIKPSSRRFPITYVYNKEVAEFEVAQTKDEQIEYLKNLVQELGGKVESLNRRCSELEGENFILKNRLEARS